jgi:hypothetical protein
MSIFKKAIDYLTGKKEFQEQINKLRQEAITNQQLIQAVQSIEAQKKPCVNKVIYNVSTQSVTVVDCNNDSYSGVIEADKVEQLKTADLSTIIQLLSPKQEVKEEKNNTKQEERELVSNFLDIFEGCNDFEVVKDKVFFKGVKSIEIPSIIVARFVELLYSMEDKRQDNYYEFKALEAEYQSLKAFTLKLLLNPLESSREQLLTFVRNNSITITKHGNLVLYRACYEGNEANELVKFVAKEYLKIKAWKKAPSQYEVFDDNSYIAVHTDKLNGYNKYVGNLAELYSQLPEMQKKGKQYYSSHGKKKIVIGDIYKIDDEDVDLNANVCHSGGLHAASVDYNYSGYGNVNLVVLINPAKTITVPTYDFGKMRVSEMMIVGINPNPQGVHISEDFYADLDGNYHNYSLEELEHALQNKSVESVSVSNAVAEVSLKDIQSIKELLSKRVINI